ncbi:MAG TPA: HAMP domain-containing sensor histidine kinase [Angustibacter sp.]|nr:HAMP domain-containing sensor histidine kinase [Angustibacter sp.]
MRHPTLAGRVTAVIAAVVTLAVLVAALVSVGLVRRTALRDARATLGREADVVARLLETGGAAGTELGVQGLRSPDTPVARVAPDGTVGGDQLAVAAATRRLKALRAGRSVSMRFRVDGRVVLAEGRPLTTGGAVVLARTEASATGAAGRLLQRELLALALALLVAVAAGALLARWLARPLRHAADGARRLAAGERDVRLEGGGPVEVVQVADAVNALAGSLAVSEARQRDFLLSVSHDLRTPLTAIRGFAESLADGVTTGERVAPVGRTILAESERLQRLVGDLLDLARLDADDLRVESLRVDLARVVAEAGDVWRQRCAATGQRLVVEAPDEPVVVHTDPVRVRQVLDGLAENAVRVTAPGQLVVLAARREGQHAVVEVRDGGPGLTDDDLAVAFDRSALHRRYAGRRPVGSGLGLAIVGALATRLGGRAEAGHAPEGGATFRLVLPQP